MTPEDYQRLSDLFARGSALNSDQRQALLDDTAISDPELRDELERLLRLDTTHGFSAPDELADATSNDRPSPTACPDIPGYEVRGLLGEGGMGQVWRAVQLSTQREVALKLIHGVRFTSSQNRARFEREVELTARLSHPHIASVFDSGFTEGYAYYAMELVPGHPLDEYIAKRRPSELARLQMMLQICRGVQHAHQRGVIHRDLKPSNVLLTDDDRPVLVDFGLAKSLVGSTEDERPLTRGMLIGTPEYMSPEQATGGMTQVDTRSDVYSLGVMLYWLLTGRLPYDAGDDPLSTIQRVANQQIVGPRRAMPHLDRGLAAVLDKSLARDPNQRYNGAGELADDLQRHLDGEPVLAASAGWGYVARRVLRKHRKSATIVVVISALILASVAGFVAMTNRHARIAVALANRAERSNRAARQAERNALRMAYIHQLALANNEASSFQFHRAMSLLNNCPIEQRGWEWRLLRNLSAPRDTSYACIEPFAVPVRSMAFSPDGRRLAIGAGYTTTKAMPDATIQIHDAESGAVISTLRGHTDGIFALAFTPDGRQLLSGSRDHTLRRWDVGTGQLLETISGPIPGKAGAAELIAFAIRFSRDGSRIAFAGYPQGLYLAPVADDISWRAILDSALHVEHIAGEGDSLSFSHDSRRLAWATRLWQGNVGHIYVVDAERAEVTAHVERPMGEPAYSIDFDPSGTRLVTGDLRSSATIYSADSAQVLGTLRTKDGAMRRVFFSADGKSILGLVGRGTICIWDDLTRQIEVLLQPDDNLQSLDLALSSDRSRIAMSTGGKAQVRLWNLKDIREDERVLAVHFPKARDVAVSPDGSRVVSCGDDGRVRLVSYPDRALIRTHASDYPLATAVAVSPDGRWLAAGWSVHPDVAPQPPFGRVHVFDMQTGQPACAPIDIPGWVWHLEFDATGEQLVVADGVTEVHEPKLSGSAHVIRWSTGERRCSVRVRGLRCRGATLSRDGQTLVTASRDTLASWSVATGQLLTKHVGTQGRNFVRRVDGTDQLLTGHEMAIEVRRLPDLKLERTFEHRRDTKLAESNLVGDAILHPDGKSIISGSWNGTLTAWDLETGQPLLTWLAHETGVHRVQFSPDGQTLFTAGHDGKVRAWVGTLTDD
jgi:serine/threonine protein kinase/WD40 repeat protein